MTHCPECNGTHITKAGLKITRQGKKQRFQCAHCGRTFYKVEKEVQACP